MNSLDLARITALNMNTQDVVNGYKVFKEEARGKRGNEFKELSELMMRMSSK
jgi:hypothetical protein